jgi:hypothetical protein
MYTCLFDDPGRINAEVSDYEAVDAATVRGMLAEVTGADNRLVLTYVPAEGPAPEGTETEGTASEEVPA